MKSSAHTVITYCTNTSNSAQGSPWMFSPSFSMPGAKPACWLSQCKANVATWPSYNLPVYDGRSQCFPISNRGYLGIDQRSSSHWAGEGTQQVDEDEKYLIYTKEKGEINCNSCTHKHTQIRVGVVLTVGLNSPSSPSGRLSKHHLALRGAGCISPTVASAFVCLIRTTKQSHLYRTIHTK